MLHRTQSTYIDILRYTHGAKPSLLKCNKVNRKCTKQQCRTVDNNATECNVHKPRVQCRVYAAAEMGRGAYSDQSLSVESVGLGEEAVA